MGSGKQHVQVRNLLNRLNTGESVGEKAVRKITGPKKREGEITVGRSTYYIKHFIGYKTDVTLVSVSKQCYNITLVYITNVNRFWT